MGEASGGTSDSTRNGSETIVITKETTKRPSSSTKLKAIEGVAGIIGQFLAGVTFVAGGAWLVNKSLMTEPHNQTLFYWGIGIAVGGAILFPSVFPVAQKVYVTVFPNGIPILGGRRATDPPINSPEV